MDTEDAARAESAVFEYACHEGNYGLLNILAGARADERAAEKGHASSNAHSPWGNSRSSSRPTSVKRGRLFFLFG